MGVRLDPGGDWLGVADILGSGVGVDVGRSVPVDVGGGVPVAVGGVAELVAVALVVGAAVGGATVGDGVGDEVGRATAVHVDVAVLVGVGVRVGVVELTGGTLGVTVFVGTSWLPMRTMIWDSAPRFSLTSRKRAVSRVSPSGKALSAFITLQNCTTRGAEEMKVGEPNASTVQARAGFVLAWKVQLKSLSASATVCVMLKSGGSNPGMPPAVHTPPGSPSPRGREASICRSGRSVGSLAFQLNSTLPTAAPSVPGTASRTS